MRTLNDPKPREDTSFAHDTFGVRRVLASLSFLLLCIISCGAEEAPFNSATISGLGARNIGSATMSGRISAIAGTREPSGKITLFVGAASGGVWKSDDSGTRYRPVFDEQPVQSIGAIALDPKNSKNVWVGTGEPWTRNSVSIGDGIYKSTDGGKTWSQILKGPNLSTGCTDVAIDSTNPEIMFAAMWDFRRKGWEYRSGGESPTAPSGSGLFRSVDGGNTWTEITAEANTGFPKKPYGRLAVAI